MRMDTDPLGPPAMLRSSMSAGILGISIACAFERRARASLTDSSYSGGPPFWASASRKALVLGSIERLKAGVVFGITLLLFSECLPFSLSHNASGGHIVLRPRVGCVSWFFA